MFFRLSPDDYKGLHQRYAEIIGNNLSLGMSPSQNEIRMKAKEWASVLKDPETRDAAEEAAEILLHQGFELPRIQEKDLGGKTKRGLVFANYNAFGKVINVNSNRAIKRAGGFRGYQKQAVEWGWSAQDNAILHELSHYIDSVINPDYDKVEHDWNVELDRKFVKKELSEYAATNRAEYEAELISGILRGKVYPKEILEYSYFSRLDDERAKHILALGNGTIPNDSGLPREFDKMAETVYRNPDKEATDLLADNEVRKFIDRQKLVFDNAVDTALKEVPLDEVSVQRLKESNYVFSGIKTFHELKETFPSLLDEGGNRKPFERFLNDVQKVHKTYNVQYLRTEYNFAHASALMAARWKKFEQDGDRYLLQYRTMYDKRVRRTHRMMHNITLPVTSPFWDKYFPPNGWNCRCTVVQVRKDKYPVSDETEAMNLGSQATAGKYQEMFMFNPGKRMTCFPAYNGYTIRKCNNCEVRPDKMKLAADIPDNELCKACRLFKEIKWGSAGNIRRMAKPLQGKTIERKELPGPILISGTTLREWTNQPHKHYFVKNKMLLDIENVLSKADYIGAVEYHKDGDNRKNVKQSHIFECEVSGEKSWIIVREYNWGEIVLHSLSDSFEKIAKGIKKG